MTAGFVVGDTLDLMSDIWHEDGYLIEVLSDVEVGAAQVVDVAVASFLRDGTITTRQNSDNRELVLPVRVRGTDPIALARGEIALAEWEGKRTTLTYAPPDQAGPAVSTVFPVWTSSLEQPYDDLAEVRNERTYRWRFVCEPFSRSESATTIGSEFVADSETIADDCESTTGWSVYGSGQTATITVDSTAGHFSTGTGAVKFVVEPYNYDAPNYVTGGAASVSAKIRKTGLSIDASGGGYFTFRFRPEPGWELQSYTQFFLTTSGGGRQEAFPVAVTSLPNGYVKYALTIPNNSTITGLDIEGALGTATPRSWGEQPPNPGWWFDSLGFASGATANQAAQTIEVGGSARGEGSLSVSAPVGLGDMLLYTCPDRGDGFRPDLRRFQTAGTSTVDTAAINGSWVPANTGKFQAPTSMLRAGAYAVLARVKGSSTSMSLNVAATTKLAGTAIGQTYTSPSDVVTLPDTTAYHVVNLGTLDLPPHRVDAAADAVVEFVLSGSATLQVDELLVFPLEDAALTWVECGSGSPSSTVASRLWVDGSSADLPNGQIVVGNDANRADGRRIQPRSKGRHILTPGRMLVYLLTSAAGGASFSGTYFKRWHTWAGE